MPVCFSVREFFSVWMPLPWDISFFLLLSHLNWSTGFFWSQVSCPSDGNYTIGSRGSQASRLRLELNNQFSCVSSLLTTHPKDLGLLDCMVDQFLVFLENFMLFSIVGVPPAVYDGSFFWPFFMHFPVLFSPQWWSRSSMNEYLLRRCSLHYRTRFLTILTGCSGPFLFVKLTAWSS